MGPGCGAGLKCRRVASGCRFEGQELKDVGALRIRIGFFFLGGGLYDTILIRRSPPTIVLVIILASILRLGVFNVGSEPCNRNAFGRVRWGPCSCRRARNPNSENIELLPTENWNKVLGHSTEHCKASMKCFWCPLFLARWEPEKLRRNQNHGVGSRIRLVNLHGVGLGF